MHHNFKAAYCQALWVLLFIMDAGNTERSKKGMDQKGRSCIIAITFNFSYIALHMKIRVPPTHILHCRVKAVFDFFTTIKIRRHFFCYSMIRLSKNPIVCSGQFSEGNILILLGLSADCTTKK